MSVLKATTRRRCRPYDALLMRTLAVWILEVAQKRKRRLMLGLSALVPVGLHSVGGKDCSAI